MGTQCALPGVMKIHPSPSIRVLVAALLLVSMFAATGPQGARAACPSLAKAVKAAIGRAGLAKRRSRWLRRLRWAALLPRLSTRVVGSDGKSAYADMRPDAPDRLDVNSYGAIRWEVRATWDLSRLLLDTRELRITALADQRHQARRQLVHRVVRLYSQWRELTAPGKQPNRFRTLGTIAKLNWATGLTFPPHGCHATPTRRKAAAPRVAADPHGKDPKDPSSCDQSYLDSSRERSEGPEQLPGVRARSVYCSTQVLNTGRQLRPK